MPKAENPRAVIGNNEPPEELTPFQVAEKKILDLYAEIAQYLDGDPITSDEMADDVASLKRLIQAEDRAAEALRVAEKQPHLDAGREIDARFKVLADKVKLAVATCKKVETPWLVKKQEAIDAAAKLAREEAEKIRLAAIEAIQARDHTNLESMAEAEQLLKDAKKAEAGAAKLEKTTAKISNMGGRASSLRTFYTHSLTDPLAFGKWAWAHHNAEYIEHLDMIAKRLVDGGNHELPGVFVKEEKTAA